ncbi:MAG TPA: ABC transporter permease [Acidimicrobiales bacterium]|nr:ABC transporter permease [Acidimicrobiales bacterium]
MRSVLTALAVAIGIATMVTLGVLTFSLRQSAVAILKTAEADFSVAQKGVADVLSSNVDAGDVAGIAADPDVERAIGVIVVASKLDADHPLFLEIGVQADQMAAYGINIVKGTAYDDAATDQVALGYRVARDLGLDVGGTFTIEDRSYRVVGLYSSSQPIADASAMFPPAALQEAHRQPGLLTMAFVQVREGADIEAVRARIEEANPQLATVRSESDFGRVDRNLVLLTAANAGGIILALVIGTSGVLTTSLLSYYERIREFGTLRAIGWSRGRLLLLVLGEAVSLALLGAVLGLVIGVALSEILTRVGDLEGVFDPEYTTAVFTRALVFAFVVANLGALYPALRAATLSPIKALRHE